MNIRAPYNPTAVEARCQARWARNAMFATPSARPGQRNTFVYACTPFTTGKAHMGHVRSYAIADVCARWARNQGDAVLWAMGFDAFGLPNEIAAIKHGISPREWVKSCCERMAEQFDRLGLSVDWSRCFVTSDAEYYKWTQWVFLKFLEHGLVYRTDGIENWCDTCHSVLASLQVTEENRCWRCNNPVRLARIPQWYLRLSAFADELDRDLDRLDGWDETVLAYQRALFGKTAGVEFDIPFTDGTSLTVFTPFPARLPEAAFIALSPNHPLAARLLSPDDAAQDLDAQRRRSMSRDDRSAIGTSVIDTGHVLKIDGLVRPLAIVVTSSVDTRFGGGAALGVPACDPVDAALASQLGVSENDSDGGTPRVQLRPAVRYKLRDSSISRQRSWGAPIPVVHCTACGQVPVREEDLPIRLPDDLIPTGEGSALASRADFRDCHCPRCGANALRDTDTLDVHFDSIWMLVPFCVPSGERDKDMFTHDELRRWLPVSQVICGADQGGWWMNDRLFFRVMCHSGYFGQLRDREPVKRLLMHEMVLSNGKKMSKSLGNIVDPDEIVGVYGADTLRLTVLRVNPRKAFNWTDEALRENHRFLSRIWDFSVSLIEHQKTQDVPPGSVGADTTERRLSKWKNIASGKIKTAYEERDFHIVLKELKVFFEMIHRSLAKRLSTGPLNCTDLNAILDALIVFLELLGPMAPHIVDELGPRCSARRETGIPPRHEDAASASDNSGSQEEMTTGGYGDPGGVRPSRRGLWTT
ncbi:class I tRNA ligase family protein [Burkholderia ubonensis]|uniref:class I tRNA ligase family protein n=1 Tax=Burkholderia ubonensis TaxID=101571 RepID=UPI0009B45E05|nr:class I tRNA ligase family protein [Burkholderia ubonensis]